MDCLGCKDADELESVLRLGDAPSADGQDPAIRLLGCRSVGVDGRDELRSSDENHEQSMVNACQGN